MRRADLVVTAASITTERLVLRGWTAADRHLFARLNADPRVMEFFPSVLSVEESDALADSIASHLEQHGWGLWAAEVPNVTAFAGYIGLSRPRFQSHFTPCVEIGCRLALAFWGSGYATEGARAVLRFGFETLGLNEIVSFTTESNRRSRRVMERIGMTHEPADDFDYPAWHTVGDTPEQVSAESLRVVGDTIFKWLQKYPQSSAPYP